MKWIRKRNRGEESVLSVTKSLRACLNTTEFAHTVRTNHSGIQTQKKTLEKLNSLSEDLELLKMFLEGRERNENNSSNPR